MVKDKVLNNISITQEEADAFQQVSLEMIKKGGSKQLLEILKDEMEGVEIRMGINIAGKQKDLAGLSDKVLSIFQFVLGNPQIQQVMQSIPGLAKSFNDIMEFSGISPVDFAQFTSMLSKPQQEKTSQPMPTMMPTVMPKMPMTV